MPIGLSRRLGRAFLPAAAALPLLWGAAAHAERLQVAGNFPARHSSSVAMAQFKTDVEAASRGQLQVELFPGMQRGSAQDNVDQVRSGALFMTWISSAYLSRTVPELSALSIPFLFTDRRAAFRALDGKAGQLLARSLERHGLVLLGFMELGPRQLTNNLRPIRTMADLKGLKIRVQPDDIQIATFRALGAEPVVLDIKDVYAQLDSRTLDAQENPFAVIRDREFNKVQRYLSHTSHFFDFIVLAAHRGRFQALPAEQQRQVRAAAQEAVIAQRTAAAAEDIGAIVELNQRGMVMDPVPPSLRVQMRRATDGIVQMVRQRAGAELVDAVLDQPGH